MARPDPDDYNAQMLAEMESEKRAAQDEPQQWVVGGRPATYLAAAAVSILEMHYVETKNPIFVWAALQILGTAGLGPHQFTWIDAYLGETANKLMECLSDPPAAKKVPATIAKSVGFGAKPFSTAKIRLRNLRLAREVLDRLSIEGTEETAIAAVAQKANLSVSTVGDAWRTLKIKLTAEV